MNPTATPEPSRSHMRRAAGRIIGLRRPAMGGNARRAASSGEEDGGLARHREVTP
jgi:hypothetical protein